MLWRLRPRSSTGQISSEIQLKKVTCVIKVFFYSREKISNIMMLVCSSFAFFFPHNCFRAFIPKGEQPLFDILVGVNGEIMQSQNDSADDTSIPDFSASSDQEFSKYKGHVRHNTAPSGRFG